MPDIVLTASNVWKQYRLGVRGGATLRDDLSRWWARINNNKDPTTKINETKSNGGSSGVYIWALQDVNFEVLRGEAMGIIGRNGAGKSTLLKILSKVTAPSRGILKLKGRVSSLLEVGTGFHPELTGRENIFLNGAILGMRRDEIKRKFDQIVDFSGVERYIDTPVKRYSSGMHVRLAFAVAAHLEPEILIIDEVLAVGDAEFQKKCLGKMREVSNEGRTILFVSHNMNAISFLCQRGILLDSGKVIHHGVIDEVIHEYQKQLFTSTDISQRGLSDRRQRTSGACLFTLFKLENKNLEEKYTYISGEQFKLRLALETQEEISSLGIYISIREPFTNTVLTTIKEGIQQQPLPKGVQLELTFVMENNLRVGKYSFYIALGDYNCKHFYDVIDENINLPVLTIQSQMSDAHLNIGYFQPQYTYSVKYVS